MVNLVYTEILKLKRSPILWVSLAGTTAAPLLCFITFVERQANNPGLVIPFQKIFTDSNLYLALLTGVPIYGVVTTYLINREYAENTLKNLLTIPVSRIQFLFSKLILLFFWVMSLTITAWGIALFLGWIAQLPGLTLNLAAEALKEFLLGGVLLFLLTTPILLATLLFKNYVPPIILTVVITMVNVVIFNSDYRALFPWSAVYVIIHSDSITHYPLAVSFQSIVITSILGLAASIIYFARTDVN